jgi:hypothetical protein
MKSKFDFLFFGTELHPYNLKFSVGQTFSSPIYIPIVILPNILQTNNLPINYKSLSFSFIQIILFQHFIKIILGNHACFIFGGSLNSEKPQSIKKLLSPEYI